MKTAFAVAASLAVATHAEFGGQSTTTPAYLSVPNFHDCLQMQQEGGMKSWCLPVTQPDSCRKESWSQLADANTNTGVPRCSLDNDSQQMTQQYWEKFSAFAKMAKQFQDAAKEKADQARTTFQGYINKAVKEQPATRALESQPNSVRAAFFGIVKDTVKEAAEGAQNAAEKAAEEAAEGAQNAAKKAAEEAAERAQNAAKKAAEGATKIGEGTGYTMSDLDTLKQQLLMVAPKMQEWAAQHSAQVLPYLRPLQQLVGALQSGDVGAVHAFMSDPVHAEQLAQLNQMLVNGLVEHRAEIMGYIADHRTELVAALEQLQQKVSSGNLGGGAFDCDLTDAACAKQLHIPAEAQTFMTDPANKAALQAKIGAFRQKRDAFVTAHKGMILMVIGALAKAIETGDYSSLTQLAAMAQGTMQHQEQKQQQYHQQRTTRRLRGSVRHFR